MSTSILSMKWFLCWSLPGTAVCIHPSVHPSICSSTHSAAASVVCWGALFVFFLFIATPFPPNTPSTHPWIKGKWSVRFHHCHDCRVRAQKESGSGIAGQVAQMGKEHRQWKKKPKKKNSERNAPVKSTV